MDNCDLEKLSCSGGKLEPQFKPDITSYKVTVESKVSKVTLDLLTSDCGASYKIVSDSLILELYEHPQTFILYQANTVLCGDACQQLYLICS